MEESPILKFQSAVRERRTSLKITQEKAAEKAGVPLTTYKRIEGDISANPNLENVAAVINGLEIDPREAFDYKKDNSDAECDEFAAMLCEVKKYDKEKRERFLCVMRSMMENFK